MKIPVRIGMDTSKSVFQLQPLRDEHTLDPAALAAMAEALSRSPDYRILRRLVARPTYMPIVGQEVRTGILLDTETTGLDHAKDEIIELGMVKFDYSADGRIVGVRDTFSAFNEPSVPISAEVTALTGITDEIVAGHRLDDAAVTDFVGQSVITIAHNSGFDRRFVERYWPARIRGFRVTEARSRSEAETKSAPNQSRDSAFYPSLRFT